MTAPGVWTSAPSAERTSKRLHDAVGHSGEVDARPRRDLRRDERQPARVPTHQRSHVGAGVHDDARRLFISIQVGLGGLGGEQDSEVEAAVSDVSSACARACPRPVNDATGR